MNQRPARQVCEWDDSFAGGNVAFRQRETGRLVVGGGGGMKHGTGIESHCALCGNEQWIHFNLRNPSLFDDETAEANEDVFERCEIEWSPASLTP